MKAKLIGVLVAVAALFIGAVLWRIDSFVYGDRMSWVEAQTRTQLSSMSYTLVNELKSLQRVVSLFQGENFQKGKLNWSTLTPYYAAASFVVNDKFLQGQELIVKEGSKAASWDMDFVSAAIGSLEGKTPEMRYFVKPFQDSKGGRYVALVFVDGRKAYALLGSGEIFQSLIDSQKGAISSFSVVTGAGLTVGHSIPEYLGTVMRDDPIFKEARRSGSSHGSNTFKTKSGELYGMYEAVPRTNLLLLSSAPLSDAMKGRKGLAWQFLFLGCGLVLVGVAAVLVFGNPAEKQIEKLNKQIQALQSRPLSVPEKAKVVLPDLEQVQKDKLQMSMKVASALAHEMRGPLASILGYSQMILAKNPEADIVDPTESIIRETRSARVLLDKFFGFAGEAMTEKNAMKIEGPLVKSLKELEPLFEEKGVKLVKNIQETSIFDLHADSIIRALKNILQNSVEAMERMPKKEITVSLFEDQEGIHLNIQDKGEGIEPQNIEKIFDPFFTTRSFQNHIGLGLPVAFGILKEHNADIRVESQRGHGTQVQILFKKMQSQAVLPAPPALAVPVAPVILEEPLKLATDLPRAKEAVMESEKMELEKVDLEKIDLDNVDKPEVKQVSSSSPPEEINIDEILDFPEPAATSPLVVSSNEEKTMILEPHLEDVGFEAAQSVTLPPEVVTAPAPSLIAKPKKSKLDSYQVEIRRPGKRI